MELCKGIKLNIGGKERMLKMTLLAIELVEPMLSTRNIINLMAVKDWSISDMLMITYAGLYGGGADKEVEGFNINLVRQWVSDLLLGGMLPQELNCRLYAMVGRSGYVGGSQSAFEEILTALADDDEEKETERKN